MNDFEKKITKAILTAANNDLANITPGVCLQVIANGQMLADLRLGDTYKYYDLASLTKIIFTVSKFMQLYDANPKILLQNISEILKWWPHQTTKIKDLLSHTAGLPSWAPFYKKIDIKKPLDKRREKLKQILENTKTTYTKKAEYSDIDFILLGFVLEELLQASLLEGWGSLKWLNKTPSFHFNQNNKPKYKRELYAPTEKCPWRKKVLQGEVHDDNTWSFGGVSTHAGLFGTIDDVTRFGLFLRAAFRGDKNKNDFVSHDAANKFSKRAISHARGDWGLGFMHPTRGSASCGRYFHSTSFGHTGFTGTSLWYDPKRDLLVTILSNRVHPTRKNTRYVKFRPIIHNLIVENL